jgi:TonB family protein
VNRKVSWKQGFSGWSCLVLALVLVLLGESALLIGDRAWAQDSIRRVKSSTPPDYPELAKRLAIRGVVRIEVTVAPDGSVKQVKDLGGNPVLLDALTRAVKKWKYEPGPKESVIEVKYEFSPP